MNWIDLKQEKPRNTQKILVKNSLQFEMNAIFLLSEKGYKFIDIEDWRSPIKYEYYGITHWKPLDDPSS